MIWMAVLFEWTDDSGPIGCYATQGGRERLLMLTDAAIGKSQMNQLDVSVRELTSSGLELAAPNRRQVRDFGASRFSIRH
jgi:hypothetical protein